MATTNQYVCFELNGKEWGISIDGMRSIERMVKITSLPKTPNYYRGIINWRNEIIPLIDLNAFFDMGLGVETEDTRIIITDVNKRTVGFIVDCIQDILTLEEGDIEKPPDILENNIPREYIKGVAKVNEKLIILLNIDKFF